MKHCPFERYFEIQTIGNALRSTFFT